MTIRLKWRLPDGHALARNADGSLSLADPHGTSVPVRPGSFGLCEALLRLSGDGIDEEDLSPLPLAAGETARLLYTMALLRRNGRLVADVTVDGARWASLVPTRRAFALPARWRQAAPAPLSRFAFMRCEGGVMWLECTESAAALALHDGRALDVAFRLRGGVDELDWRSAAFAALLSALGIATSEPQTSAARMWEFHDRVLFSRSRLLDDLRPSGGTFRFADELAPPPAEGAPFAGRRIPLPDARADGGASFRALLERRRSRRTMGATPVGLAEIAVLFDRVERVRPPPADFADSGIACRPRPSGGALYELRFYLAAGVCEGLKPALHHYDPHDHALVELEGSGPAAAEMLAAAADAWQQPGMPPQALIVVSSRHPRVAFKYEGMAYRLSLLHAGIVIQGLYLACTELGLHGCAVGTGAQPLFERATGLSSFEEASIAEFGFGTAGDDS